ncbi:fibrous sheath-interacting protein 1-like isoform X1 [Styela clava]
MDITRGEFNDFLPISSRSDTRSSIRSEMASSMEILPPEENFNSLFMSEEVSDDDNDSREEKDFPVERSNFVHDHLPNRILSQEYSNEEEEIQDLDSRPKTSSSFADSVPDIEDEKLKTLIKKMKKYDRILLKKTKREKEVKRQTLIFQKQLLEELASTTEKNETTANIGKYLALMPPPAQLQEMLDRLDKDEFVPIFPTQINFEKNGNSHILPGSASLPRFDKYDDMEETKSSGRSNTNADTKQRSSSAKSAQNGKIDFIKRNIELAKDAGNYISMTEEEKKRLNELLSDLDQFENSLPSLEGSDAITNPGLFLGDGYKPDVDQMKRLAEIDEKIQALLPSDEFEMICGTPHLTDMKFQNQDIEHLGEKIYFNDNQDSSSNLEAIQQRLENIDQEWKEMYEGTTPKLSNEQLQKLLEECSISSSARFSSRSILSSFSSQDCFRSESQASESTNKMEEDIAFSGFMNSVVPVLSRETLDNLLDEARQSLGISDVGSNESVTNMDDENRGNSPLFRAVARSQKKGQLFVIEKILTFLQLSWRNFVLLQLLLFRYSVTVYCIS